MGHDTTTFLPALIRRAHSSRSPDSAASASSMSIFAGQHRVCRTIRM
jgi:hypothetical protein